MQRVFIGQSADSLGACSREQFYVSVSRGKERTTIYTDDKKALLEAVKQSDERLSATELVRVEERERGMAIIRSGMRESSSPRIEPSIPARSTWDSQGAGQPTREEAWA